MSMELPPVGFAPPPAVVRLRTRRVLAMGGAYGLVVGLLGALQIIAVALAISLNQRQILLYQDENDRYHECLRQAAPASVCHPPTAGVLTVESIWLLFLATYLALGLLALLPYGLAGRALARHTGQVGVGVVAALAAGSVGWLMYLAASVVSVLAQSSPFTMGAPPPGVDIEALHVGAAIGVAIANSAALLPTLCLAALAGLVGAAADRRRRMAGHTTPVGAPPPRSDEVVVAGRRETPVHT